MSRVRIPSPAPSYLGATRLPQAPTLYNIDPRRSRRPPEADASFAYQTNSERSLPHVADNLVCFQKEKFQPIFHD